MNILDAIRDDNVFGQHFKADTWRPWLAFLAALFALPMTDEQLEIYRKHTGRSTLPSAPHYEAWLCIGRRGGKSFILACISVFLACFKDWRKYLGPGEVGTVMVIAADRRQARVIMRYCVGLLNAVPMLKRQVEGATRESISLRNRVVIEIHTASFRTTRGYSIVAALLDEIAYMPVDETSAEPDVEIVNSIRPAMATIPGSILLAASSPYARRGALWDAHRKHYGRDGDPVLVWQAATRDMNATVPQSFIDQHMAEDPARASAEYLATFRSDLQAFIDREQVQRCVVPGMRERPPDRKVRYWSFGDMSGGSHDSAVLCIAHNDIAKQTIIVDLVREIRSPHSPEQACEEFSKLLAAYGCHRVVTDKYALQWPIEQFRRFNITAEQSAEPKGSLYTTMLPYLNSQRCELLDEPRGLAQICALERSTGRGRGDVVDHPPNALDDVANAIAGAISVCAKLGGYRPDSQLDDKGLLKPGGRYRVPMFAMDAASVSADQRVSDAFRRGYERGLADARKTVQRDPLGRVASVFETEGNGGNGDDDDDEPPRKRRGEDAAPSGPAVTVEDALKHVRDQDEKMRAAWLAGRDESNKARSEWMDSQSRAYKGDAPTGALAGHGRVGDKCMVDATHEPGTLQMVNGSLVCVPDKRTDALPRTMSASDAERIKEQSWREMLSRTANAWRGDR